MRPNTLAEAVRRIARGENRERALCEVLDSFYGAGTSQARLDVLTEAPPPSGDARLDAYVAAAAEYLCKQSRIGPVPVWVSDPHRILTEPWFTGPSDAPAVAAFLMHSSPAEFRARNIFTEERPLRRARASGFG